MRIFIGNEMIPLIDNENEFFLAMEVMDNLNSETIMSKEFSPKLIENACQMGFFPMATTVGDVWYMFMKSHKQRCVMDPRDMYVEKKLKKISKEYEISVNGDFEKCIDLINQKYSDSWLCSGLVDSFKDIYYGEKYKTKFYSFELWKDGEIVAGEVGYLVGACYTSLSGFHNISHSGKVQLCATAQILIQSGIKLWDLGMELPYKLKIGAQMIPKDEFVTELEKLKKKEVEIENKKTNAYDLMYSR